MERPKMTSQMQEALKKYILRERRKKREEDELSEQKIREEMKKVEMNTQTLEQNKTQLKGLEVKLSDLELKRHELFNQLKKVLNEWTTLKKSNNNNNRPPIALTPSGMKYQQLIVNQLQQQDTSGMFSPSSGPPQITSQPPGILPIPSKTPPNSISSPSIISGNSGNIPGISKPQSPFHQPQLMHHMGPNFPIIPPGGLKYGLPAPLSPQVITAHQHASPSSSPRNHIQPGTPNSSSQISTPNSKRPRSPSPQTASSTTSISQFPFNQGHLTPSRSPATHVVQSPPPSSLREQIFNSNNSPSNSNKKSRNTLMNSNSSPSLASQAERERQQSRNSQPQSFNPPTNLTPQQQSAFSAYHQSLINSRGGPLNTFQPQPPQHSSNKHNKSPNVQAFQPLVSPQASPNFIRGTGNLQPPSLPPPAHSPLNFNSMTNHYLKQLAQEATHKIFQQQNQQQQHNLQQHLLQQQQLQMFSAAAAAAAAATSQEAGNSNGRLTNSTGPSMGTGGGSILTGFARPSSNSSQQQRPPSNY